MGPELGDGVRLGLESLPRRARAGGPNRSHELGTLGPPAGVGATPATRTAVGTRSSGDVESDGKRLGILEQPSVDADLTRRRLSRSPGLASRG